MIFKLERFCLLAATSVLIAGCGGGSSTGGGGGESNPTTVTISFSTGTPSVVAAKIGSGSFTAQSLSSGKLSLSIPSGTKSFAVAYVCAMEKLPDYEEVFEASTADGTSFTLLCPSPMNSVPTGTLTGNVDASAIPEAIGLGITVSDENEVFVAGLTADLNFSFTVPAGNDRVQVGAYSTSSPGTSMSLVAIRNLDNQTVPGPLNGGNQVVLGAADRTTFQSITYNDIPSGYSAPYTVVDLILGGVGGSGIADSTSQYPVLPAGAFESGDFYDFFAYSKSIANPTEMAIVAKSSSSPGAMVFSFPAPWSYSGPTAAALPTFNFAYSGFTGANGVYEEALTSWSFPQTAIMVTASANYQNGSTSLAFPDLSGLTGFITPPASGTQVAWIALIAQNNLGIQVPMTQPNSNIVTVENSGTYTVP